MTITGKGARIGIRASYTPDDAFSDLVRAVRALYESGHDQTVRMNEEPEVIDLHLLKRDDKLIVHAEGDRGFEATQVEADFVTGCREFARRFKHVLEDDGYDRFAKEWRHRPPRDEVRLLWSHFSRGPRRS